MKVFRIKNIEVILSKIDTSCYNFYEKWPTCLLSGCVVREFFWGAFTVCVLRGECVNINLEEAEKYDLEKT